MKLLTESQLKDVAEELGLEFEEAKLMYERALNSGMLAEKSLKSDSKLLKVVKVAKRSKPADEPEETVRTKAVGIQGGVPNGSQTRLRRQERMVTPLRDVVHGKLLAILKGNWPTHMVGKALAEFTQEEVQEATAILKSMSVTEFFKIDVPKYAYKSTGVEWQDNVQASMQQVMLKQDLEREYGSNVIESYKALTHAVNAAEQAEEAARLNRAFKPVDRFTSQTLNQQIHPAILAEMERKGINPDVLTRHKSLVDGQQAAKADARVDIVYAMATSTAMNPELETTLKALTETLPPPDLYSQFTSRKLNGLPLKEVIKTERQQVANAYNHTQLAQMMRDEENLSHFHSTGKNHPRYSNIRGADASRSPR